MANSPVDRNEKSMKEDHGTVCLITDLKADYYLAKHREQQSRWQDQSNKSN